MTTFFHRYSSLKITILLLSLVVVASGCRNKERHEVSEISVSGGIVKVGMSAHEVKVLLGPPCTVNNQMLTCSSATGPNAESTRILYWVLEATLPFGKQVSVYDLSFTKTHPWAQVPGDPAADSDKAEAGWTIESIRRQIINNRDFERWKRTNQVESE